MSNKIQRIFHKCDSLIFEQIDMVKQSQAYLWFSEGISGLDDDLRKFVSKITLLFLIGVPFILILLFWNINSNLRAKVETKLKTHDLAKSIIQGKKNLKSSGGNFIKGLGISNSEQMGSKIKSVLSSSKIATEQIKVKEFSTDTSISSIIKSEAKIFFEKLSLADMTNLIKNLTTRQSFKINEVEIKRNSDDGSLTGFFHVYHFGRSSN